MLFANFDRIVPGIYMTLMTVAISLRMKALEDIMMWEAVMQELDRFQQRGDDEWLPEGFLLI